MKKLSILRAWILLLAATLLQCDLRERLVADYLWVDLQVDRAAYLQEHATQIDETFQDAVAQLDSVRDLKTFAFLADFNERLKRSGRTLQYYFPAMHDLGETALINQLRSDIQQRRAGSVDLLRERAHQDKLVRQDLTLVDEHRLEYQWAALMPIDSMRKAKLLDMFTARGRISLYLVLKEEQTSQLVAELNRYLEKFAMPDSALINSDSLPADSQQLRIDGLYSSRTASVFLRRLADEEALRILQAGGREVIPLSFHSATHPGMRKIYFAQRKPVGILQNYSVAFREHLGLHIVVSDSAATALRGLKTASANHYLGISVDGELTFLYNINDRMPLPMLQVVPAELAAVGRKLYPILKHGPLPAPLILREAYQQKGRDITP